MPFERYLRDDSAINTSDLNYYYQDYSHENYDDGDCHYAHNQHAYFAGAARYGQHHTRAVQLQIPPFMLNGPHVLAPGGGAEVLQAGLMDSSRDSFSSSWFANNRFAPFDPSLTSKQLSVASSDSASTIPYHTFRPGVSQHLTTFPSRPTANVDPWLQSHPESLPSLETTDGFVSDHSSPHSAGSSNVSYVPANLPVPSPASPLSFTVPSTTSLPVYSTSGYDVLSLLSRVVNRPNPTIQLGPVDMSCSFVVVDVRRHDCPIVYASPTFSHLTGYSEHEILGRNCRFLQSPVGNIAKGEPRRFTSPEAVSCMRKLLASSKECQTTLINYRKGGQAFINLVTVIPLRGGVHDTPEEADEVAYHIGFQVDLSEQPNRILDKLRDGNHHSVDGSRGAGSCGFPVGHDFGPLFQAQNTANIGLKGGRHGQMMSIAVSKELRNLIADPTFTDSVPISIGTNITGPAGASSGSTDQGGNATTPLTMFVTPPSSATSMSRISGGGNTMAGSIPISLSPSLSLLLLEYLPDFLLVLSLKGAFLYVAPSVRLVLGYESQELVGRGISDVCHPADLVPLMRELKEGSVSGLGISGTGDVGTSTGPATAPTLLPKSVDLLFRALPKASTVATQSNGGPHPFRPSATSDESSDETSPPYVWLECRGRLHVEPGKGRKAIILSGRARWMPVVRWGSIDKGGGIGSIQCRGDGVSQITAGPRRGEASSGDLTGATLDPPEFWALLSSQGTFLVASASVRDVLGWGTSEVIGQSICAMVRDSRTGMREHVEAELAKLDTLEARNMDDPPPSVVTTSLVHRGSHIVPMRLAFYRTPRSDGRAPPSTSSAGHASTPLIHPLNNPSCPIVCQGTVLANSDYALNKDDNAGIGLSLAHASGRAQMATDTGGDKDESDPAKHAPGASVFEELEIARGSSWQYELQQLKFANQRLHEEVRALEVACAKAESGASSSPMACTGAHASSSTSTILPSQTQVHYTPMPSTLPTSLSSLGPSDSLHEQDPPTSDWSSLTGANGQGLNPLKRSWHSENGPTT